MSNYFLKHYIKKINQEYLNNIKKYIDKNEIIPTSCFYYNYSSKIKSAIDYALSIEKEYKQWFNETINSYSRNRNYFQFNFTKKQNDELKSLYLSNKTKAKENLLNELSNQNKIHENQKEENNKTKENKQNLENENKQNLENEIKQKLENEIKQKSSKDKEKFEKIWSILFNLIKQNSKELLELADLY